MGVFVREWRSWRVPRDPITLDVPFVWENRERGLFKETERFRFADKRAFDFRGRRERATGQKGRSLADSNERAAKGFVPTYTFQRDYRGSVGRFKLDWFFIKRFIQDPRRAGQATGLRHISPSRCAS